MTRSELPPLAPEMRTLLERATSGPGPSAEAYARLKARIDHTIGGGAGTVSSVPAQKTLALPRSPVVKALLGAGTVGVTVATIWIASRGAPEPTPPRAPVSMTTPQASADTMQPSAEPPPSTATPTPEVAEVATRSEEPTTRPVKVRTQPPAPSTSASAPEPVEPAPADATSATAIPSAPTPARDVAAKDLPRERLMLEQARRALASSAAPRAIELLDRHVAEFADGQLREEREALMVQALVAVGNPLAAAARARAFRARYPRSIFLDLVDAVAPAPAPPPTKEP